MDNKFGILGVIVTTIFFLFSMTFSGSSSNSNSATATPTFVNVENNLVQPELDKPLQGYPVSTDIPSGYPIVATPAPTSTPILICDFGENPCVCAEMPGGVWTCWRVQ